MRLLFPILLLWVGAASLSAEPVDPPPIPAPAIDFNHLPWRNGEALTYIVSWSGLEAAEGTFTSAVREGGWEFKLALVSRGMINDWYPFTNTFWSILASNPWRSIEYGEYRFEPKRTIRERTQVDYATHKATREMWNEGKTKKFDIPEDGTDDVGTMLYHLRAIPWKPGLKCTLFVYEGDSTKEANCECTGIETKTFGTWPSQPMLRIRALPGKGTHHRGGLTIWLTNDARKLPLHADLEFRYGTFSVDLTKLVRGTHEAPSGEAGHPAPGT